MWEYIVMWMDKKKNILDSNDVGSELSRAKLPNWISIQHIEEIFGHDKYQFPWDFFPSGSLYTIGVDYMYLDIWMLGYKWQIS